MRTAQAAAPSCDEVLQACDAALKSKEKEIDLANYGIRIRDDSRVDLQKQNDELRSAGTSIWSNPFLWATVGLFVGAYTTSRITR